MAMERKTLRKGGVSSGGWKTPREMLTAGPGSEYDDGVRAG